MSCSKRHRDRSVAIQHGSPVQLMTAGPADDAVIAVRTEGRRFSQARHWLVVLVVRGSGGVAGVAATVVASRFLGAHAAGVVFLALAIVRVLATLSRLGLDNTLVRFIGTHAAIGDWARVNGTLKLALKWSGSLSLCVGIALFLLADPLAGHAFHKPELAMVLHIMAWLVPLIALYSLCAQAFIGVRRPELATILLNICLPVGFACLLVLGLRVGIPASGEVIAAGAYVLSALVALMLGLRLWRWRPQAKVSAVDSKAIWRCAAPLWIVATMGQVVLWSGQIASGVWLSAAAVAHLAAAQRVAMMVTLVMIVTNMLIAPQFATLHHQGKAQELRLLARRATRLMIAIATPVSLVMVLYAATLMDIFGPGFDAGVPLLRVLVLGQWVNVVTGSVSELLQMTGHERDLRKIAIFSGILIVALSTALTMKRGAIGAAWAITLAIIMQNTFTLFMVRRRLGFFTI